MVVVMLEDELRLRELLRSNPLQFSRGATEVVVVVVLPVPVPVELL